MRRKLNLWETTLLGVGAQAAGRNLPLAFLLFIDGGLHGRLLSCQNGVQVCIERRPHRVHNRGIRDNAATGTLTLLMWMSFVILISLFALLFNLNGIASTCSAAMLMIYTSTMLSYYRLVDELREVHSSELHVISAIFSLLMIYQWQTSKEVFLATWMMFGGAFLVEKIYRSRTRRTFVTRTEILSRSRIEVRR